MNWEPDEDRNDPYKDAVGFFFDQRRQMEISDSQTRPQEEESQPKSFVAKEHQSSMNPKDEALDRLLESYRRENKLRACLEVILMNAVHQAPSVFVYGILSEIEATLGKKDYKELVERWT